MLIVMVTRSSATGWLAGRAVLVQIRRFWRGLELVEFASDSQVAAYGLHAGRRFWRGDGAFSPVLSAYP